jgi:hypothetical protein
MMLSCDFIVLMMGDDSTVSAIVFADMAFARF